MRFFYENKSVCSFDEGSYGCKCRVNDKNVVEITEAEYIAIATGRKSIEQVLKDRMHTSSCVDSQSVNNNISFVDADKIKVDESDGVKLNVNDGEFAKESHDDNVDLAFDYSSYDKSNVTVDVLNAVKDDQLVDFGRKVCRVKLEMPEIPTDDDYFNARTVLKAKIEKIVSARETEK